MTDLNEYQKDDLLISFCHIDKLLLEFECVLDVTIPRSPLQQYINDVDSDSLVKIKEKCDCLRQAMCRILREKDISIGKPNLSVLNKIYVSLVFADIAIEELGPQHMKGYGKLSASATEELNAMVKELKELLKGIKANLPE